MRETDPIMKNEEEETEWFCDPDAEKSDAGSIREEEKCKEENRERAKGVDDEKGILHRGEDSFVQEGKTHLLRESYQLSKGELLSDRYEIEDVLGCGGFGITYLATDHKLEMKVAIKEYFPSNLAYRMPWSRQVEVHSEKMQPEYEKGRTRFLEEAQNMAQFSEERHIVHVYNYFQENDTAYLVMEYLEGCTLKKYTMQQGGKLSYLQVTEIMKDVLRALAPLHKKRIIHRDISPDNLFICKDGTVKLIDFGAARFAAETDLQQTRSVILKPGYAPPEQYRAKGKIGPWTDIYALGATMYYAVTGEVPDESVNREIRDTLIMPGQIATEIPDYLNTILMKCMALSPSLRFQRVEELEKRLEKEKKVAKVATTLFWRRSIRTAIVLLFLAGVFGAVWQELQYVFDKQKQASLQPCEISVLTIAEDGDVTGQEERMRSAIAAFEENYPFVQVQIRAVEKNSYEETLQKMAEEGTLPTVFESACLDGTYDAYLTPLTYTLQLLDEEDLLFARSLWAGSGEIRRIPTSVDCVLRYCNTVLSQTADAYAPRNDLNLFLQEKSSVYYGSLQDYAQIQKTLAGKYEVQLLQDETQLFLPADEWSVCQQATEDERNAGERLLYYLMGEQAQDVLYVQNEGGIPMEKASRDIFCDINPELGQLIQNLEETQDVGNASSEILEEVYQRERQNK